MNGNPFDPAKLSIIQEPLQPPEDAPSTASREEEASLEQEKQAEELRRARNDNDWRERIPSRLWWLTVCWLLAVLLITLLSGFNEIDSFNYVRLSYDR